MTTAREMISLGLRQEDILMLIRKDRASLRRVQAKIQILKKCERDLINSITMMASKHVGLEVKEFSKN